MRVNQIELNSLVAVGADLHRPECVLATQRGEIYVSDSRGGIMHITPGGNQRVIGSSSIHPNGFAMLQDGSFLVVNNSVTGGIWRIARNPAKASVEPYLTEVEGLPLIGVNFILLDHSGRIWITISSSLAFAGPIDRTATDGYIVLLDQGKSRIVADKLSWTNECRVHPDGKTLYVVETFGRRLVTFRIAANGDLSERKTVVEFGDGDYPDGLAFDAEGAVWLTNVFSNRLIRIMPDGERQLVLEDLDPALAEFETAFQRNALDRTILRATAGGSRLRNISSLAFGGPDLRTVYLGCLSGNRLESFRSPIAGVPPPHWAW
jgi:sugar lactone lactonase YvrE